MFLFLLSIVIVMVTIKIVIYLNKDKSKDMLNPGKIIGGLIPKPDDIIKVVVGGVKRCNRY